MSPTGEFDFLTRLRRQVKQQNTPNALLSGIGDDAAVFRAPAYHDTLISTDLLVEEIDFRLDWITPSQLGHKALAVSLSDIAAMGGRPRWSLVSLGVPAKLWRTKFKEQFYRGYLSLADQFGVTLVGGDLSRTPEKVVVDSIMLGEAARGRSIKRSGAQAGDAVFVTGTLGGSAGGLKLLAEIKSSQKKQASYRALIAKHLLPTPRVDWGLLLSKHKLASAMIDLSDGISSDLHHLCRDSGVGARIDSSLLPLHPNLPLAAQNYDESLALALDGGEDYELLFTVHSRQLSRLPAELNGVPVTRIGEITENQKGVKIKIGGKWKTLKAAGYRHF